tara:strand:+ start:3780 stop:4208 length:429 start_codon:yes stop_codon:yes gene_type:complete
MNNKTDNYSNWKIGDFAELNHKITEEDVISFAKISGDNNPIHMDKEYAKKTFFGERIVHGMFLGSLISNVIGTKLPGSGSLWISQKLNFLSPARIGDEILIIVKVSSKSETLRVLTLDIEIKNQYGTKIVTGESKIKIAEFF